MYGIVIVHMSSFSKDQDRDERWKKKKKNVYIIKKENMKVYGRRGFVDLKKIRFHHRRVPPKSS